jgi:hypothetical protein
MGAQTWLSETDSQDFSADLLLEQMATRSSARTKALAALHVVQESQIGVPR